MAWNRIRGQNSALETFRAAVTRGRLGQAYLLVGPDGVGKRLFARELTKALLCENSPAPLTACDHCPACTQVEVETHPDLYFLRTREDKLFLEVDDMRQFCSDLSLKPTRGSRKIGIVETADDLNESSSNAFLKRLEEPPPGSLLLLIATSTESQLATIRSRCQVVHFQPLLRNDLQVILQAHGVTDPVQLKQLIAMAGGSAGRAIALNNEDTRKIRSELFAALSQRKLEFGSLAGPWQRYVESAGKEANSQRMRAVLVVNFLIEALRGALRRGEGIEDPTLDAESGSCFESLANTMPSERMLELLDICIEAEYRILRIVQVILVIEHVVDQFTRVVR